mgnify:CR=1 FL=1
MNHKARIIFSMVICWLALMVATPTFAQAATPPQANGSAGPIGYFLLVIGLLAIGIVGLSTMGGRTLRASFASNESDEELIDETDDGPIPAKMQPLKLEVPTLDELHPIDTSKAL